MFYKAVIFLKPSPLAKPKTIQAEQLPFTGLNKKREAEASLIALHDVWYVKL